MSSPLDLTSALQSEDDIRTKVVAAWLGDHGFTAKSISVEKGLEIRHGRGVFRVDGSKLLVPTQAHSTDTNFRPRIDLLVRAHDGRNLLIIEVKKQGDAFGDDEKEQAISYARLLRTGGMAPFVILTDGKQTDIFDTYTGQSIVSMRIPATHPHVRAGFRISGDDLALRAEALEALISISSDNLLAFCGTQVQYRMRMLRSEDAFSSKKYIPQLYIERDTPKARLIEGVLGRKNKLTLVLGPPQQGKTCFICHAVEEWLAAGNPCLFYSAIGLHNGLGAEIMEDFEWTLGDTSDFSQLASKMNRILAQADQRLVLFIDGWNEPSRELALNIDQTLERLLSRSDNIAVVLSTTNRGLSHLLLDPVGNPTFVADTLGLRSETIRALEIDPTRELSDAVVRSRVVAIEEYNAQEAGQALRRYKDVYGVSLEKNTQGHKIRNPFLLRTAMEHYSGQTLPDTLDEPGLLGERLFQKARRSGIPEDDVLVTLADLGKAILSEGIPLPQAYLQHTSIPYSLANRLFDCALLAKTYNGQLPCIDFYVGRERDYVIAYLARDWSTTLLASNTHIVEELTLAQKKQVGLDALSWFLSLPQNIRHLCAVLDCLPNVLNSDVRVAVLTCLDGQNIKDVGLDRIRAVIDSVVADLSYDVKEEVARLIVLCTDDFSDVEEEWMLELLQGSVLVIDSSEDVLGEYTLEAFKHFHEQDELQEDGDTSSVTDFLEPLLESVSSGVRSRAAYVLGYLDARLLLQALSRSITIGTLAIEDSYVFEAAVEVAVSHFQEEFYGSMCPGTLEWLLDSREALVTEYEEMKAISLPILEIFYPAKYAKYLFEILKELQPPDTEPLSIGDIVAKRYQLRLPLGNI